MAVRTEAEFAVGMTATDNAGPAIRQAGVTADEASAKLEHLSLVVTGLNQAMELAHKAFEFAKDTLKESVGAYLEVEHAQHELETAMKLTGQFSEENVADFKAFSAELKNTTLVTGAQVTAMLRQGTALGKTHDQTKLMAKGAVDLAHVLHTDVNSAFNQLIQLSNGAARGLGKMFPEIKTMIKDGTDGSEAVAYLTEKIKGFGEAAANTASGQMTQLQKSLGALTMSFGEAIVTLVRGGDAHVSADSPIAQLTALIREATQVVKDFKPTLQDLHDGFVVFAAGVKGALVGAFKAVDWEKVAADVAKLTLVVGLCAAAWGLWSLGIAGVSGALASAGAAVLAASASVLAMVQYFSLLAASFAVAAVQIGIVVIAVATLATGIEILSKNTDKLGKLFRTFFASVFVGFETLAQKVSGFLGLDDEVAAQEERINKALAEMADASEGLDLTSTVGSGIEQITKLVDGMGKGFDDGTAKAKEASHAIDELGNQAARAGHTTAEFTKELQKQFTEVIKKSKEALEQAKKAGLDEIEVAKEKRNAGLLEISTIEGKIAATGRLSAAMKDAIALARAQREEAAGIEIAASLMKQAEAAADASKKAKESAERAGDAVQTAAQMEYVTVVRAIQVTRERADAEGYLTKQLEEQFQMAEMNAQAARDIKISKAFKKDVDDAINANIQLAFAIGKVGAEQSDLIDMETEQATMAVDAALAKARAEGVVNQALVDQLVARKELIKAEGGAKKQEISKQQNAAIVAAIGGAMVVGAEMAKTILSGAFVQSFASFLDELSTLPDKLIEALGHIDVAVNKLLTAFPQLIQRFLDKFPSIAQKLIAAIPQIVSAIAKALPQFAQEIANAAPAFVKAIMAALPELISAIGDAIGKLVDALPAVIDGILKGLPKVIEALLGAIGHIIAEVVKAIPKIITDILNDLPEIVQSIIQGLLGAIGEIVEAFITMTADEISTGRILSAFLKMIPKLVVGLVNGIINGLKSFFKAIGGAGKITVPPEVQKLGGKIADGFKAGLEKFKGSSSKIFNVADMVDAAKAANPKDIAAAAAAVVDEAIGRARNMWQEIYDKYLKHFVDMLVDAWRNIYNTFLKPPIDLLRSVWQVVFTSLQASWAALKAVWDLVISSLSTAWNGLVATFKAAWDLIVLAMSTVGSAVAATVKAAWDLILVAWNASVTAFSAVWSVGVAGFKFVVDILKATWDFAIGGLTSMWDTLKKVWKDISDIFSGKIGLLDGVRKLFGDMFDGFMAPFKEYIGKLGAAFSSFTDALGTAGTKIWDGVKAAVTASLDIIKGWGSSIWDGLSAAFTKAKDIVTGLGTTIWGGVTAAWGKATDAIKGIGSSIWDGLKAAFDKAGDVFKGIGGQIWEGLKSALGGIGDFLKGIFDKLNPANLFEKIFHVDMGGTGTVENALGIDVPFVSFATGGVVPGAAPVGGDSAMNDRIMAMLSAGEAIIPRSKMAIPGVADLVQSIIDGKVKIPQYFGGVLGAAVDRAKNSDEGKAVAGGAQAIGDAAQHAAGVASGVLGDLDPTQLWGKVKDFVFEGMRKMFAANHFAEGGLVGAGGGLSSASSGGGDMWVSRAAPRAAATMGAGMNLGFSPQMGGNVVIQKIEINARTNLDADAIRREVIPAIDRHLRQKSQDGGLVVVASGVRK